MFIQLQLEMHRSMYLSWTISVVFYFLLFCFIAVWLSFNLECKNYNVCRNTKRSTKSSLIQSSHDIIIWLILTYIDSFVREPQQKQKKNKYIYLISVVVVVCWHRLRFVLNWELGRNSDKSFGIDLFWSLEWYVRRQNL